LPGFLEWTVDFLSFLCHCRHHWYNCCVSCVGQTCDTL